MNLYRYPGKDKWNDLTKRPVEDFSDIEEKVVPVLKDVREQGDEALKKYTKQFDQVELTDLQVGLDEISNAGSSVPEALKTALLQAKNNIEKFHQAQYYTEDPVDIQRGVKCWRKSLPIEKVGLYIPGGSAPLFSTLLMLGVPAKVAGCKEIVVCTPPDEQGNIHPAILYTAGLIGIEHVYRAGGAQAIAAMAYGTQTIPAVYKIFGPGNQYVTAAKQLINKEGIPIDMPAGPSEVLVVADNTANPGYVAADLLSQAEHGPDSQVVLVTDSEQLTEDVEDAMAEMIAKLPRKDIAEQALKHSKMLLMAKTDIMDFVNAYAPEHLILSVENPEAFADLVINAGSVFMGHYTPESAGDYASGTNHTLPTNGFAKAYSGVSLDSFVKKVTFQEISREGLDDLGDTIETMAEYESLIAHKWAVSKRRNTES